MQACTMTRWLMNTGPKYRLPSASTGSKVQQDGVGPTTDSAAADSISVGGMIDGALAQLDCILHLHVTAQASSSVCMPACTCFQLASIMRSTNKAERQAEV